MTLTLHQSHDLNTTSHMNGHKRIGCDTTELRVGRYSIIMHCVNKQWSSRDGNDGVVMWTQLHVQSVVMMVWCNTNCIRADCDIGVTGYDSPQGQL